MQILSDCVHPCLCVCCRYQYQNWISGPLLDRIDFHIEVPRVDYEKLSGDRVGNLLNQFEYVCKPHGIFNENVSEKQSLETLHSMI
jgi:Magnesium chelatase, subunit ChlI